MNTPPPFLSREKIPCREKKPPIWGNEIFIEKMVLSPRNNEEIQE